MSLRSSRALTSLQRPQRPQRRAPDFADDALVIMPALDDVLHIKIDFTYEEAN
jgi:hypothetical protein